MKRVRGAPRVVFFSRWVAGGLSIHILECSMCVFDVTDYCGLYADKDCILDDLIKSHARDQHKGVPRLVETIRP